MVLSVALAMMQLSPVMTMTRSRRALKQMFFFIIVWCFVIDVFCDSTFCHITKLVFIFI